jgi:hypothetical protein
VAEAVRTSASVLVTDLAVNGESVPGPARLSSVERRALSRVLRVPRTEDS